MCCVVCEHYTLRKNGAFQNQKGFFGCPHRQTLVLTYFGSMQNPLHRGFYIEPKRVLPGTKNGSTWNQKGFSYGDSGRTLLEPFFSKNVHWRIGKIGRTRCGHSSLFLERGLSPRPTQPLKPGVGSLVVSPAEAPWCQGRERWECCCSAVRWCAGSSPLHSDVSRAAPRP